MTYEINLAQQRFLRELRYLESLLPLRGFDQEMDLLTQNRLIRRNASEPTEGGYILTEMLPAYKRAAGIYGR